MTSQIIDSITGFVTSVGFPGAFAILFAILLHREIPKIIDAITKLNSSNQVAHKTIAKDNLEGLRLLAEDFGKNLETIVDRSDANLERITENHSKLVSRQQARIESLENRLLDVISGEAINSLRKVDGDDS